MNVHLEVPREIAEIDFAPFVRRTVVHLEAAWQFKRWPKRETEIGARKVYFDGKGDSVRYYSRSWKVKLDVREGAKIDHPGHDFVLRGGLVVGSVHRVETSLVFQPAVFAGDVDDCLRDLTMIKLGWPP